MGKLSSLAPRNPGEIAEKSKDAQQQLRAMLENPAIADRINKALPAYAQQRGGADYLVMSALRAVAKNPTLLSCGPASIYQAVMDAASVGLPCNGESGLGYLVPFKGRAVFIPGWQGLAEIAFRTGVVKKIVGRVVYEGDHFEVAYGTEDTIMHRPSSDADRELRPVVASYAVAWLTSGETVFEVVSRSTIDRIRSASPGANADSWTQHFGRMAEKTAVRRLCKKLPKSEMLAHALDLADQGDELAATATPARRAIPIGNFALEDLAPNEEPVVDGDELSEKEADQ